MKELIKNLVTHMLFVVLVFLLEILGPFDTAMIEYGFPINRLLCEDQTLRYRKI